MADFSGLFGNNWDDPKTQGMLQAAAAMMQAGGPSRIPVSFGQALSAGLMGGMQGYQGQQQFLAKKKAADMANAKDAIELQQLQQAQKDKEDLANLFRVPIPSPVSQSPTPASDWRPPMLAQPQGSPQSMPQAAAPQSGSPQNGRESTYQTLMQKSQQAMDQGRPDLAMAARKMAESYKPEVQSTRPIRGADGNVQTQVIYKDGTVAVLPGAPAEKPTLANFGSFQQGLDPYTLQPIGGKMAQTMSPDAAASNAVATQRLVWDKSQASKPQFHDGSWLTPPGAGTPQGAAVPVPGFTPPMTESQANANIFSSRANEANRLLTGLDGKFSPMGIAAKQSMPGMLTPFANSLLSPDSQKAEQAQRDFVNAVLRKESGSAISDSEFENAKKQYFPQPGDGPEVIQQKYENRVREVEGMKSAAGKGANFDVYRKGGAQAQPAVSGKAVVQTGTYGGKKVVKYSDGSIEYAN